MIYVRWWIWIMLIFIGFRSLAMVGREINWKIVHFYRILWGLYANIHGLGLSENTDRQVDFAPWQPYWTTQELFLLKQTKADHHQWLASGLDWERQYSLRWWASHAWPKQDQWTSLEILAKCQSQLEIFFSPSLRSDPEKWFSHASSLRLWALDSIMQWPQWLFILTTWHKQMIMSVGGTMT